MQGFRCFPLIILAVMLGSCTQTPVGPEPLDFSSDPRILRGVWVGEEVKDKNNSLVLYLEADAPTQDGYQITGFIQELSSYVTNVSGTVTTPLAQGGARITAQQSPTCSSAVFAQSQNSTQDGGTKYELCGEAPTGSPPHFDLTLTQQSDTGAVFTYTFSMVRQPSPADPNLLVRGDLVYTQGGSDTHPEPFEFAEDSHAIVQLWYWVGPYISHIEPELITSTTLENISNFPIEYRLEGNAEEVFARRGEYFLNVGVFSGNGGVSGEQFAVGDLTNETVILVPNPGAEIEAELTSLESCSSPDADGPCVP